MWSETYDCDMVVTDQRASYFSTCAFTSCNSEKAARLVYCASVHSALFCISLPSCLQWSSNSHLGLAQPRRISCIQTTDPFSAPMKSRISTAGLAMFSPTDHFELLAYNLACVTDVHFLYHPFSSGYCINDQIFPSSCGTSPDTSQAAIGRKQERVDWMRGSSHCRYQDAKREDFPEVLNSIQIKARSVNDIEGPGDLLTCMSDLHTCDDLLHHTNVAAAKQCNTSVKLPRISRVLPVYLLSWTLK